MEPTILDLEQGSQAWHDAHCGRISGSVMADAQRMSKPLAKRLRREIETGQAEWQEHTGHQPAPLAWGNDNEPKALAAYEMKKDVDVVPIGFMIHPELDWLCGSPDAFVLADGAAEVKCPWDPAIHIMTLAHGMPQQHIPQVQTYLAISGRQWCDFISFDPRLPHPRSLYVERIARDQEYIDRMLAKAAKFMAWVKSDEPIDRDLADMPIPELF